MAGRISAAVVAERLGVSERTVLRMAERREIRALRVGRRWSFDPADVEAFEARHTSEAASERPETGATAPTPIRPSHTPAVALDGPYIPVARGEVPWRQEVIPETNVTHRAAGMKSARPSP